MSEKKNHWIKGIDNIRFFLALIVLLSHFPDPFVPLLKNSPAYVLHLAGIALNHLFFGVAAVIAFFVISGFVIHYPNRNNKDFNVGNFLLRRWLRIGIPLIIIGLVSGYFHNFYHIPIWSLYCELIYYTLYPLLYKIKLTWKTKLYVSFAISSIIILVFDKDNILSLIHQKNLNYNINYWQLGVSLTWLVGLPCWLLGVNLADKIDKLNYDISTAKIYLYRLLVFSIGVLVFSLAAHWYLSCILTLNFFALIIYTWIEKEIIYHKAHSPSKVFEYFGKFSYSLYLCHQLCFVMVSSFLTLNQYTYFLYIFLSLLISYIVYLAVEYPAHKLAQKIGTYSRKSIT